MTRFLRLSRKMRSSGAAAAAEEDDHPSPTEEGGGDPRPAPDPGPVTAPGRATIMPVVLRVVVAEAGELSKCPALRRRCSPALIIGGVERD